MDKADIGAVGYDFPRLVETQRLFFASGEPKSLDFRLKKLALLENAIIRRSDDILAALNKDLGKPSLEAYLAEVHFVISEIRLFRKKLRQWSRPRRVGSPFYLQPARSEIRRDPYGIALIVAPWNYPFQLSMSPLIAALGAGNCVFLKPSDLAPSTSNIIAEIISEVFEARHVTSITGGPEVGKALLSLPFDYWFYTGGERIGKLYATAAAGSLAPITLELGGKCPCFLDADIDLDLAAARVASAKFFNAGQTCIAPDFVLVHNSIRHVFVEKLAAVITSHYTESGASDLSRIVSEDHYRRLKKLISGDAIRIGVDDPEALRLVPRILPQSDWSSPAMSEEVFGPILPILGYDSLEEAIERLRSLPSPLALYVFSRNSETLEKISGSIRSGSVCFNDAIKQATNLRLPFGGVGQSGMGRYHGRSGFETFSYER